MPHKNVYILLDMYMFFVAVNSLKEKRTVVKSIIERAKSKFNISIAEVDKHDYHKTIVLGFVCVSTTKAHTNSIIDNVINFLEGNSNIIINDVIIEIL